jgi:UDP-GlcNAc:undecaprenyl-phosphate/decaprenyl-phosphate GlcNAc-1-phosphate transferase
MNGSWDSAGIFIVPAAALILTIASVPVVSRLAARWGCIALPKRERWHTRPTPTLGGLAFWPPFLFVALLYSSNLSTGLSFFAVGAMMFVVGMYDDLRQLRPATKLLFQMIAAAAALCFGYRLNFFSWGPLDALLTAVWIVGLTNALNLLDNMDGLASGIGLIAAVYLAFLFNQLGDRDSMIIALALAGALGGFLFYNFHPAAIFMGDAGSLFLGTSLSLLTVRANGEASNILSLVAVPTCVLLVPILDTTLVTVTRVLRGQPISQGGRDHASHRLVVLGLSEAQAVLLLYLIAAVSGASALLFERFDYGLSVAFLPLVIVSFALFAAYLAQVEIVSDNDRERINSDKKLTLWLSALTYKGGLLEIALDFFLIAFSYYLAFDLRYEFNMNEPLMKLYFTSLPIVLVATYLSLFLLGVYRGLWRYTGLHELVRIGAAVAFGTILTVGALMVVYRFVGYSKSVFILYSLLLFLGMAGSRLSFRLFGLFVSRPRPNQVPVLIYGAGDGAEVLVRVCREDPRLGYQPVGFLDDDPRKEGTSVLGLKIFGGPEKLPEILQREQVHGCIISSPSSFTGDHARQIRSQCEKQGLWIKQLRLEFVEEGVGKS